MKLNIQITSGNDIPVATSAEISAAKMFGIIGSMMPMLNPIAEKLVREIRNLISPPTRTARTPAAAPTPEASSAPAGTDTPSA